MRILVLALFAPALLAQATNAEEQVNLGVKAYQNARYDEAVEHFSTAVRLDPAYLNARLYLATAYMSQYIPGAQSPENLRMAQRAHDEFQQVLALDPENDVAMASIASLYYSQKKFEDAREWYEKLTSLDPENKEAWYTLGVIAWSQFYPAYGEARARLHMKPDDPGPLPDADARAALKARWGKVVADGIQNLEHALRIDPEYDDAMAYMNLLIRERADWAESKAEYNKDTATADDWVQKALETKKRKAERRMPRL
jgi:tetratricopeptide (TPR) repeat protein